MQHIRISYLTVEIDGAQRDKYDLDERSRQTLAQIVVSEHFGAVRRLQQDVEEQANAWQRCREQESDQKHETVV